MQTMERFYRERMDADDLVYYAVAVKETDLYIGSAADRKKEAEAFIRRERHVLEAYLACDPMFRDALCPTDVRADAPLIARKMAEAAKCVGVGPMAAVAGAFAGRLAEEVYGIDNDVIIENGGDIFLKTSETRIVEIYAGESVFKNRIRIKVTPGRSPLGICTSSGKFGHSLSFGKADAVCILSPDPYLADAAATAVCNRIKNTEDIQAALEYTQNTAGLTGAIIICDEKMGAWGDIEFV